MTDTNQHARRRSPAATSTVSETEASRSAGVAEDRPADATEWVCPMHPDIVRAEPGECPKCGMALEPRDVGAEPEDNPELMDMTRRFWVGLVLTVPLVVIAMGDYIPGRVDRNP